MSPNREKIPVLKKNSLFIFQGKTDILLIGLFFILLAFFLYSGFFLQ